MNMFKQIKAEPKPAAKAKEVHEVIKMDNDLGLLASAKTVIKTLEGVVKSVEAKVKHSIIADIKGMLKTQHKMPKVQASTAGWEARVTLSKKTSVDMGEEVRKILDANDVHYERVITTPERFVFNPELIADEEIQTALHEAIMGHPKLRAVADKLVQLQAEASKYVPSDATLTDLATKVKDKDLDICIESLYVLAVGHFKSEEPDSFVAGLNGICEFLPSEAKAQEVTASKPEAIAPEKPVAVKVEKPEAIAPRKPLLTENEIASLYLPSQNGFSPEKPEASAPKKPAPRKKVVKKIVE